MKRILLPVIVLLIATNLYSQDKNKISGGLYVKGGTSWLMSDNKSYFENEKVKLSYGMGAIMDINLNNNFAINIAAGYNNIGGTAVFKNGVIPFKDIDENLIGGVNTPFNNKYKYATSYIELPISIKGSTNEIGYFTYFLKLGADPMVRIKNKITTESKSVYVANKATSLFNIGWHVGGGFEWSLAGNTRLLVEVLYLGTFIDLDKLKTIKDDASELNPNVKINDITLKIGILF